MATFGEVLDFWFGSPANAQFGRPRDSWFAKSDAFDAEIRARFGSLLARASDGALDQWTDTPLAALALVILFDQFPRNMHRGMPAAFASDGRALAASRSMVERGFDRLLLPVQRWFAYLPFEHAEDLAAQRRSMALFAGLRDDPDSVGTIDYARRHYDVIARFGRFPHRNAILGRASTMEETEFLKLPGASF